MFNGRTFGGRPEDHPEPPPRSPQKLDTPEAILERLEELLSRWPTLEDPDFYCPSADDDLAEVWSAMAMHMFLPKPENVSLSAFEDRSIWLRDDNASLKGREKAFDQFQQAVVQTIRLVKSAVGEKPESVGRRENDPVLSPIDRLLADLLRLSDNHPDYLGRAERCESNDSEFRLLYHPPKATEAYLQDDSESVRKRVRRARNEHNAGVRALDSIAGRVNRLLCEKGIELPNGTTDGASLMAWVVADRFVSPDGKYSRGAACPIGNPFEAIREKLLEVLEGQSQAPAQSSGRDSVEGTRQRKSQGAERKPPPPFDAASTDWIFGAQLAKALGISTAVMSDYRKSAEVDAGDESGRWGADCIGTFRREVSGKAVAYYVPELKPNYRSRFEHSKKLSRDDGGSIENP